MKNPRLLLLSLLSLLIAIWGVWSIYSGWGLVSLNVKDTPVNKVLASISRQGGIEIVSDLDPSTTVSLNVRRVSPVEALDIVAIRTSASWRLSYLGAPNRSTIESALAAFRSSTENEDWLSFGRGGAGMFGSSSGQVLDLRNIRWEPSDASNLQALAEDASDKTGVMLAIPKDWNPSTSPPSAGSASQTIPRLFAKSGGISREVFLLHRSTSSESNENEPPRRRRSRSWIGAQSPSDHSERGPRNPEAMHARAEAQIALLPKAEQAQARKDLEAMRKIWSEVRDLPEDQRQEKMREIFNRPEVAERMEQLRLAREAKMTPDQRIQRSKRYWDRKASSKHGNK